jgi:hypothetical protein
VTTTTAGVLPPSHDRSADEPGSLPPPFPFFSSSSLIARAARPSGDEEEPPGSLGGGRASPGVEPEGDMDQRVDWDDATSAESVAANVYMTFVSPGTEDQRNAYSVEVLRIGRADALTHEWQTDTQQLIKQLATQVPQLAGRPFPSCCSSRTALCRSHRTSQTRRNRGRLPRPVAPRVPPSSQGSHRWVEHRRGSCRRADRVHSNQQRAHAYRLLSPDAPFSWACPPACWPAPVHGRGERISPGPPGHPVADGGS